jgi:hypothetical protein
LATNSGICLYEGFARISSEVLRLGRFAADYSVANDDPGAAVGRLAWKVLAEDAARVEVKNNSGTKEVDP